MLLQLFAELCLVRDSLQQIPRPVDEVEADEQDREEDARNHFHHDRSVVLQIGPARRLLVFTLDRMWGSLVVWQTDVWVLVRTLVAAGDSWREEDLVVPAIFRRGW